VLACSGALLVYHVDRAINIPEEDFENAPKRIAWYKSHRFYLWVSGATALGLVGVAATFLPFHLLVLGASLGVLGIIYGIFIPGTSFRIKDIPIAKTLLIIFCWIFGSVLLPLKGEIETAFLLVLAGYKGLAILPNILVANWMDREGDKKHGVLSSRVWLGWNGVRYVTLGCFVVSLAVVLQVSQYNNMLWLGLVDLAGLAAMSVLIWRSSKNNLPDIVYFDLLVGFSLVTWLLWLAVY